MYESLFLASKRPRWITTWAARWETTTTTTACAVAASSTAATESATTTATTAAGHAVYAGTQRVRLSTGVSATLVASALVV